MHSFCCNNVDLRKIALKQEGIMPFLITRDMIRNIRL